jgi:predicted O-methyltransferase YrrM
MVDLTKALEIPGWMGLKELTFLAEQAQGHSKIVELGSYKGKSTRALADNTEGFVLAIDNWQGPTTVNFSPNERGVIFSQFYLNCEDLMGEKLFYLTADHMGEIEIDFVPDMVFIDGNHDYLNVKHDIEQWMGKLAKGGLLCGHDADYPGVERALKELLPDCIIDKDKKMWRNQ